MKIATKLIAASAVFACAGAVFAQTAVIAPPQNVLQLSATGTVEVQQDLLVLTLATTKEGADAAAVQTQLKQALDSALAEAKRTAQPEQMDVRTGTFGMYPRYGKEGKINGWQGRAELVLQGRDFSRITTAAGKIQSMSISQIAFDLSREAREKVEGEAQTKAIEQFKARANELAKGFGFSGYTLREVAVNSNEMMPGPRPRMMAMEAKAASMSSDSAVPVEAGKAQVVVNVSGAVQLR
ncbi:SIMPL domain-containing protein [Paracidovorax valerianellae]|uniref:Predicted secreted protein n=1 Tax=Paracidovorax valerianellae TaxID=187868 RepID=A0A1G7BXA3_9BURK|nr:SIMPL domain-containing protein [Paracidovorax valerianellae]MDA8446632.1 SIMPL domain-containing protein [Paracidovorax valerianellae]SDE31751.1 Predicted secreted protein [Paracidovorax valerianellae]